MTLPRPLRPQTLAEERARRLCVPAAERSVQYDFVHPSANGTSTRLPAKCRCSKSVLCAGAEALKERPAGCTPSGPESADFTASGTVFSPIFKDLSGYASRFLCSGRFVEVWRGCAVCGSPARPASHPAIFSRYCSPPPQGPSSRQSARHPRSLGSREIPPGEKVVVSGGERNDAESRQVRVRDPL